MHLCRMFRRFTFLLFFVPIVTITVASPLQPNSVIAAGIQAGFHESRDVIVIPASHFGHLLQSTFSSEAVQKKDSWIPIPFSNTRFQTHQTSSVSFDIPVHPPSVYSHNYDFPPYWQPYHVHRLHPSEPRTATIPTTTTATAVAVAVATAPTPLQNKLPPKLRDTPKEMQSSVNTEISKSAKLKSRNGNHSPAFDK